MTAAALEALRKRNQVFRKRKESGKKMKRIIILLFAFMCVHSLCFAQWPFKKTQKTPLVIPAKVPTKTPAAAPKEEVVEYKIFTGLVVSILSLGEKSEISVKDAADTTLSFAVNSLTGVYDAEMNNIALSNIQNGQKVRVKYIAKPDGTHQAASIRILKK
jgi:hypothetical protein